MRGGVVRRSRDTRGEVLANDRCSVEVKCPHWWISGNRLHLLIFFLFHVLFLLLLFFCLALQTPEPWDWDWERWTSFCLLKSRATVWFLHMEHVT